MEDLPLDRDTVLAAFAGDDSRVLKVRELADVLGLHHTARAALRQLVRALVDEGDLVAHPGRRFSLSTEGALVEGRVQRHKRGFAWLIPDDDPEAGAVHDAFLPPDEAAGLLDGDRVLCRISPSKKGPVGKVVKILSRGKSTFTGTLRRAQRAAWVEPHGSGLPGGVRIPEGDEGNADTLADGTVVEVLIVRYPTQVTSAVGRVVRALGREGEIAVEVERLISEAGIVRPFSPETEEEAARFPTEPSLDDAAGRFDVTQLALCTIDGETAKDFDDAVYAEPVSGGWRVLVAIADVAHYVRPGTALEEDARARGTSVYYPGACIPMLPEALSNGLCSLNPQVRRLCMVAELVVTPKGKIQSKKFHNGVMRSFARLTYTQVQALFDGDEGARSAVPPAVQESLGHLRAAALALRQQRSKRGSLDFDLHESLVETDENGEPVAIRAAVRAESNRLIEDLMIAANEAVASHLEERELPCVYRIHEPPDPDKLDRFLGLAKTLTGKLQGKLGQKRSPGADAHATGKELGAVLDQLAAHRLKNALEMLLLRAMMQARYSADNVGHFGLASEAYAHFTSPIRRYPDLLVHRLLKEHLAHPKRRYGEGELDGRNEELEELAAQSSNLERRATDAERKIDALFAAWLMRDRVGDTLPGTVTGCAEFACWVRFDDPQVEGQVSLAALGDDRWSYDELRLRLVGDHTGFSIGVGDRVVVQIANVSLADRKIELHLLQLTEREGEQVNEEPPARRPEGAGGPQRFLEARDAFRRGQRGQRDGRGRDGASGSGQRGGRGAKSGRGATGGPGKGGKSGGGAKGGSGAKGGKGGTGAKGGRRGRR